MNVKRLKCTWAEEKTQRSSDSLTLLDERNKVTIPVIPTKDWIKYYNELLDEQQPRFSEKELKTNIEISREELIITRQLIKKAIKQLEHQEQRAPMPSLPNVHQKN